MEFKDTAVSLLKERYSPSGIAIKMGKSIEEVIEYLNIKCAEGAIRKTEILFSIKKHHREIIEKMIKELVYKNLPVDVNALYHSIFPKDGSIDYRDIKTYLIFRDPKISRGDMYILISDIELLFHQAIKNILIENYGSGEFEWWRKGIPKKIRSACAASYEEDDEPVDNFYYCYTTFTHLKDIFDEQWKIFSSILPKKIVQNKKLFLSDLEKLRRIRNLVMHPMKSYKLTEDDFIFVRDFSDSIRIEKWQKSDVLDQLP